jgi:hypothetical protein
MTEWRMNVDLRSVQYGIWHLYGPIIELGPIGKNSGNDFLVMSPAEGRSVRDPIYWDRNLKNERTLFDLTTDLEPLTIDNKQEATGFGFGAQEPYGMPYPTARGQMQLNAYYQKDGNFYHAAESKGPGLYLSTHDSHGYPKVHYATSRPAKGILNFSYGMFPDDSARPGLGYTQPYPHVIGTFDGDWYDAATIYRDWATKQVWCARGTLAQRRDVPDWVKHIVAWVRLDSKGAPLSHWADSLKQYRDELDGILAVQWYRWEEGMERCRAPGVCGNHPPIGIAREGWAEVIEAYQAQDVVFFPYINPRLWAYGAWKQEDLPTVLDFEIARPYVSRKATGEIHQWGKGYGFGKFAKMCVHPPWWRNYILDVAESMVKSYDIDGIYLDQSGECSYGGGYYDQQACHDPRHGHPLGITKALVDAERERTRAVMGRCQAFRPDFMINGEGAAENWIDHMNNKLIHYEIWPGYVPLYGTVYHDYQTYFGRVITLRAQNPEDPKPQMQIGWQLILGNQLGRLWPSALETEVEHRNLEYLKKACTVKNRFARYLNLGRMLRPPYVSETPVVTTREFKRMNNRCSLPAVVGSTWRSPDGRVAIVLTNLSTDRQPFTFGIDLAELGFAPDAVQLTQVYPADRPVVVDRDGGARADCELAGLDIVVFEVREKN